MAKTKNKTKSYSNKKSQKKSTLNKINLIFCCIIIVLSVYYVFGVNDLSIKGFRIYDLKSRLSDLSETQEDLEARVMQLESYEHIVKQAEEMNLVKADRIDYISAVNGVAIRD